MYWPYIGCVCCFLKNFSKDTTGVMRPSQGFMVLIIRFFMLVILVTGHILPPSLDCGAGLLHCKVTIFTFYVNKYYEGGTKIM